MPVSADEQRLLSSSDEKANFEMELRSRHTHLSQTDLCFSGLTIMEVMFPVLPIHTTWIHCYKQFVSERMKQIYRTELSEPRQRLLSSQK